MPTVRLDTHGKLGLPCRCELKTAMKPKAIVLLFITFLALGSPTVIWAASIRDLPRDEQIAVDAVCSLAKASSPTRYRKCVREEISNAEKAGFPSTIRVHFEEGRTAAVEACQNVQAQGLTRYRQCLSSRAYAVSPEGGRVPPKGTMQKARPPSQDSGTDLLHSTAERKVKPFAPASSDEVIIRPDRPQLPLPVLVELPADPDTARNNPITSNQTQRRQLTTEVHGGAAQARSSSGSGIFQALVVLVIFVLVFRFLTRESKPDLVIENGPPPGPGNASAPKTSVAPITPKFAASKVRPSTTAPATSPVARKQSTFSPSGPREGGAPPRLKGDIPNLHWVCPGSIKIASRIETATLQRVLPKYDRIVFLDVETTGFSAEQDRVLELAFLEITSDIAASWIDDPDLIDGQPELHRFNPLQLIPREAAQIHGITAEIAAGYPPMDPAFIAKFMSRLGPATLIVGHRISYDIRMLQGETVRLLGHQNVWQPGQRHVCTVARFQRLFPKQSARLDACLSSLGISGRTTGIHGAAEDVILAARLFAALARIERAKQKK